MKITSLLIIFFASQSSFAADLPYTSISQNVADLEWAVENNNSRKACYQIGHLSTILYSVKSKLFKPDALDETDRKIIKSENFSDFYVSIVPLSLYCDPTRESSNPKIEELKSRLKDFKERYEKTLGK